ncbi:MAG: HDIG domain-containing protein [Candidatus Cloacimonetes bacterium]|nr:HDIG domain-containing protein [Candidatus Cloacimonadota bacterium]
MITRNEAMELLKSHLKNDNLIKHCIAVGAIMEGLSKITLLDSEVCFITGLLHDIDFEYTKDEPEKHGFIAMDILKDADITAEMKNAILSHTGNHQIMTDLDKCLWASDPLSGLVIASALMNPEKKIRALSLKSLLKKFKTKSFAAGADREQIRSCENFGIALNDFLQIAIESMSKYDTELGL